MIDMLRLIVREYGWIHRAIGLFGNLAFVVGSVLFLPQFEPWKVTGVWLFIVGAAFMFIGALGQFFVNLHADDGS
ncbi:MAG: YrhK family protein [Erythrobacter sp.]|uniref:YrhK family protein n=1 Tax=Erythrobacter sp. TaxID=1042 RepID=UPI0032EF18B6